MKTVRKQIAEAIVAQLLEFERACCMCEKEFGVQPRPNVSHGYCKRHTLEMYAQVIEMARQRGDQAKENSLLKSVEELKDRPDEAFCPDISRTRQ